MKKSFNIQELLHRKSKCHGTKPMHPSSLRAFQRHQKHDMKDPSLVDLIITTQNKLPSFINRLRNFMWGFHQNATNVKVVNLNFKFFPSYDSQMFQNSLFKKKHI
jgi:hypothetical protein